MRTLERNSAGTHLWSVLEVHPPVDTVEGEVLHESDVGCHTGNAPAGKTDKEDLGAPIQAPASLKKAFLSARTTESKPRVRGMRRCTLGNTLRAAALIALGREPKGMRIHLPDRGVESSPADRIKQDDGARGSPPPHFGCEIEPLCSRVKPQVGARLLYCQALCSATRNSNYTRSHCLSHLSRNRMSKPGKVRGYH
jgi:hypothetical protein